MVDFWNERFAAKAFAYGELPNQFFANELKKLKTGRLLFPAEGEGRNAIYAAKHGFEVVAFDPSKKGRQKAIQLATRYNTSIEYHLATYESFNPEKEYFDSIILIFAHMPAHLRETYHRKLFSFLKPGGSLILQGFSKDQINRNTGGPRNLEMLFSKEELLSDFKTMATLKIEETEVMLNEGEFHNGLASVIQFYGIK